MKLYKLALSILIFLFSCSPEPCPNIELRDDGLTYYREYPYNGSCGFYADNKLLSKQNYSNGLNDGMWVFYFENGKVQAKGRFDKGDREGKWKYYFENGNLKQIASYRNNLRHGKWELFNQDKELITSEIYENGSLLND